MQNWIQNWFWFTSEFQRKIKGQWKEKQRKGNKGIHISNTSKAQKLFIHLSQQMVWQLQETWALQVEFLHQFCTSREGRQQYLLGLHKFTPSLMHSHMVTCYRFFWGGPISLHGLVHFLNTSGPSLTKLVYAYFDCILNQYIYTYISYIYIYMDG